MTAPDPRLGEIEDSIHGLISTVAWPETPEERDEAETKVTAHINHLLAELRKAQDALGRVLEWCDTNQHPFHPSEGAEGFSSQDWALDDAARRIRTAVAAATGGGE